jgi:hypothetical protein
VFFFAGESFLAKRALGGIPTPGGQIHIATGIPSMRVTRTHLMIGLAFGLVASGLNGGSLVAHDGVDHKAEKKISSALAGLSEVEKKQVVAQRFCPMMTHSRLGAMGAPIKAMVEGKPVFVCCKGCVEDAVKGGKNTLKTVKKLTEASATLAKLPSKERAAAESQKYCAVANTSFLGSMGAPIKLELNGKPVYLCCEGCEAKAKANPVATLAKVEQLKKAGKHGGHDHAEPKHADTKGK